MGLEIPFLLRIPVALRITLGTRLILHQYIVARINSYCMKHDILINHVHCSCKRQSLQSMYRHLLLEEDNSVNGRKLINLFQKLGISHRGGSKI